MRLIILVAIMFSLFLSGCEGVLYLLFMPDKKDDTSLSPAPQIISHPASDAVVEGQTAMFNITAIGAGSLTYQWKKNGIDVTGGVGGTTDSYTTPAAALADSGAQFTCVVTNSIGSVESNAATLTVNMAPPQITAHPVSDTVVEGQTASFSVTATGSGTLTYQWKKNGVNVTGGIGGTTPDYTTPAAALADDGAQFACVVTNGGGDTTSNAATLTVDPWSITVMSPNGGETWTADELVPVTWSSAGSISDVKIELTTNGGGFWSTLIASTANDGAEDVMVPNTPSTQCLIRVSDTGSSAADESDDMFAIVEPPTITVTSPNGGETWTAEDTELIEWTSTGLIDNVKIELSTNGGSSWTFLATSTPNDGSHSITVPDTPSALCLLRVSDLDNDPTDMSDGLFTIIPREEIDVISPNGGELWRIGSTQTIYWDSEIISNVKIDLSRDGNWTNGDGSDVETIVASTPAAAGEYDWIVAGATSATCLICISDASDGDPMDISDAAFEIAPRVWYVDSLATAGGDGKTWGTAFQTIQDGIAAASAADDVWVKGGTYSPTINLKADVCVYGGFAGTEVLVSQRSVTTNLTAINGTSSSTVIGADNARFDGFTVDGASISSDGGGLNSSASNLVIANCTFNNNDADDGGAVYLGGGSATFSKCSFTSNDADDDGGAVYTNLGAFITLDECYFYNNRARGDEGRGGAICINDSTIVVDHCVFEFNDAQRTDPDIAYGGAIYLDDSDSIIRNSRFDRNDASGMGAAIYIHASSQNTYEVINCEILRNYAIINGGGLAVRYADYTSSPVKVINCSFCNNEARDSVGGGIYNYGGSELTVVNTIIVRNFGAGIKDQIANADTSVCDITYSCIEGWAGGGIGNINGDTGDVDFVDDMNDLRLQGTSVCIDAANGNIAPATDKDGNGRFDHPRANTGTGTPNYVDMGAYERQSP